MPSKSHARCKVCRVIIHSRQRYGLCPRHTQEYTARLRSERQAVKERKAARANPIMAAILDMELTAMSLKRDATRLNSVTLPNGAKLTKIDPPDPTRAQPKHLSDDERLEVGRLYEHGFTYSQIKRRTGAGPQTVIQIAKSLGLPERGRTGPRPPRPPEPAPAPAPDTVQEDATIVPTPSTEELWVDTSAVPVSLDEDLPVWQVKVRGALLVPARSIQDALQQVAREQPDLRITGINLVDPTDA